MHTKIYAVEFYTFILSIFAEVSIDIPILLKNKDIFLSPFFKQSVE